MKNWKKENCNSKLKKLEIKKIENRSKKKIKKFHKISTPNPNVKIQLISIKNSMFLNISNLLNIPQACSKQNFEKKFQTFFHFFQFPKCEK